MKKILLPVLLMALIGLTNQIRAQCSGTDIRITNFTTTVSADKILYEFSWEYIRGHGSIEVIFISNGSQVGSLPCISRVKDSAAGPHLVKGTFTNGSWLGSFKVELRVWTNPDCSGNNCILFREVSQSSLPVQFKTFTATKQPFDVLLQWDIIWEQNSAGFIIERNTSGVWDSVGYVATKAPNGNSSDQLSYMYADINNIKSISQYRIRQMSLDRHSKYSDIRLIQGDSQLQMIVYPVPITDGKVNVSFEDAAVRDITVSDIMGRTVRQIKGISNNNITIENLAPGTYVLMAIDPATRKQAITRIVVIKQ